MRAEDNSVEAARDLAVHRPRGDGSARRTGGLPLQRALALLVFIELASAGQARGEKTVAVLDLHLDERASGLAAQVLDHARKSLRKHGYRIVSPALVQARLRSGALAAGCRVGPCLAELHRRDGVDLVLSGGLGGEGSSYDLAFTLLETGGGSVVAQLSERCDVCTFDEVGALVGRMIAALAEIAARQLGSQGWLIVRSAPAGAQVFMDGVLLGRTPLRRLVAPGRHEVQVKRFELPQVAQQRVNIDPGRTVEIDVRLGGSGPPRAAFQPQELAGGEGSSAWLAWGTLATGLAAGLVGAVLLGVHDDCLDQPACTETRETRVPGAVLASLGLLASAASGVLFWRTLRGRGRAPVPVDVAIGPDQLGLSFGGTY